MTASARFGWAELVRRAGLFAALTVLLDLGIGTGLSLLLPHAHGGGRIGAINRAIDAEADVVILGSSQALRSYDDAALTRSLGVRVHNAGLDGHGVLFARGLLALISERKVPKLVVLDVAFSFRERPSLQSLAPYYGRSPIVDRMLTEGDWRAWVKLRSRSFRMNGFALSIAANLVGSDAEWGFTPLEGRLPPRARVAEDGERPRARVEPFVEESLVALVEEARRRGSKIIFALSPTFGDARPAGVRPLYERVAARLDVPTIELPPDALSAFGPELFKDPRHLNADGAAIFTSAIAPHLGDFVAEGWGR